MEDRNKFTKYAIICHFISLLVIGISCIMYFVTLSKGNSTVSSSSSLQDLNSTLQSINSSVKIWQTVFLVGKVLLVANIVLAILGFTKNKLKRNIVIAIFAGILLLSTFMFGSIMTTDYIKVAYATAANDDSYVTSFLLLMVITFIVFIESLVQLLKMRKLNNL